MSKTAKTSAKGDSQKAAHAELKKIIRNGAANKKAAKKAAKEARKKLTIVPLDRDVKLETLPLIPETTTGSIDRELIKACSWVPGGCPERTLQADFTGHGEGEVDDGFAQKAIPRAELEKMSEVTNTVFNRHANECISIPGQVNTGDVQPPKPVLYANDIPDYVLNMFVNPLPECELESTVNVGNSVTVTYANRSSGDSVSVTVMMGAGRTESGKVMNVSSVIRRPRALYQVNALFTPYDLEKAKNASELYSFILSNLNIVGG